MLDVSEIFGPTIQGEGKKIGTPSIFIRLGRCNFDCDGFGVEYITPSGVKKFGCDSYYAVDSEFKKFWKSYETSQDLINVVENYIPKNYKPDIVITGGEPIIYWKNPEFQKLLEYYVNNNFNVTIETNGSLDIELDKPYQQEILYSISVKLSNVNESYKKRVNFRALNEMIAKSKYSYLKFVIDENHQNCIDEINDILSKLPKVEVFLMPKGDSNDEVVKNSIYVIELCVQYGYKYSDRLHIRIWDNKRGV
ncbi:7-carboxy-7-deazaguanine synthase QueE [Arcobacter sp. FWKO B]|uniref:7-carboxy-7-deazaguanine synthase QueE n=1 Tax=Arcobacter sp. FWKO B TaxID=2593672 RepID=UPI0018A5A91A|nr:7-carboxy-7-deazaguanine synthase QueE [Arcobacter sp. FWKO B]QOG11729.1 7-carboxy-7-deazaguanine synthase QueE [Arcobacter sp. FWKO B]